MQTKFILSGLLGAALLVGCSPKEAAVERPVKSNPSETAQTQSTSAAYKRAPSGVYSLDPTHAYIVFTYSHHGYSTPFLRWKNWESKLDWNDENPSASSVSVDIQTKHVDSGVDIFDAHLQKPRWFNAETYPDITFISTALTQSSDTAGVMTGDLTLKGIKKPVTLDVTFNKAAYDQRSGSHKIGFSAKGVLNRSEWDLGGGVPSISDQVNLVIEAEYSKKGAQ